MARVCAANPGPDGTALGALVIGDGTNPYTCSIEGEALTTDVDIYASVMIKLGAGVNRPLVYVRKNAASPIFRNVRLEGNAIK